MNLDFCVLLDGESKSYKPGENICGKVQLKLEEPFPARFLNIYLEGGAHTRWIVSHSKDLSQLDGSTPIDTRNVVHFSSIVYAKETITLWGDGSDDQLEAGNYEYPFSFKLPDNCPPSFDGEFGYILYKCKAAIHGKDDYNYEVEETFTMISDIDLTSSSSSLHTVSTTVCDSVGLLRRGKVQLKVSMPKEIFDVDEEIPVELNIVNMSTSDVHKAQIKLIQYTKYHAPKCHLVSHPKEVFVGVTNEENNRHEIKEVETVEKHLEIHENGSSDEVIRIRIPRVVQSFDCDIILVAYQIQVRIFSHAFFHSRIEAEIPIYIGHQRECRGESAE